jgi:hypothetical protein
MIYSRGSLSFNRLCRAGVSENCKGHAKALLWSPGSEPPDTTNKDLKFVKCNDSACSGGDEIVTIVDGDGGSYISMTVGADGLPVFSYHSSNPDYDLKAAHCGSAFCLPYFRR